MNSIVTLTNLLTPVKNKKREYDKSTNSSLYNSAIFTQKSQASTKYLDNSYQLHPFGISEKKLLIKIKKSDRLNKRRILKEVLGKILMIQYLRTKTAFIKISQIPIDAKLLRKQQKLEHQVAEQLIFKTPLTLQTSILRSVINLRRKKLKELAIKSEVSNSNIKSYKKLSLNMLNHSVTIYPHEEFSVKQKQRAPLLFLQELVNRKLRRIIRCFYKNYQQTIIIKKYLSKTVEIWKQNQLYYVQKLKQITRIFRENVKNSKKKHLQDALGRCMKRRDKIIFDNVVQRSWHGKQNKQIHFGLLGKSLKYQKLYSHIKKLSLRKTPEITRSEVGVQIEEIDAEEIRLFESKKKDDLSK